MRYGLEGLTTRQLLEELQRRGTQWRNVENGNALADSSRQLLATLSSDMLEWKPAVEPDWADLARPGRHRTVDLEGPRNRGVWRDR